MSTLAMLQEMRDWLIYANEFENDSEDNLFCKREYLKILRIFKSNYPDA